MHNPQNGIKRAGKDEIRYKEYVITVTKSAIRGWNK